MEKRNGVPDTTTLGPIKHDSILAGRLGWIIPSGVIDIDISDLASQVDEQSPIYHCPEGFSKRASYLMSALHLLLILPRQFRTQCGSQYSCDECPIKPLQE